MFTSEIKHCNKNTGGTMITLEDVEQAKTNPELANHIVKEILYDGVKPKFRMYLFKMGIPYCEIEELELHCTHIIIEYISGKYQNTYTYDTISFEKYVWNALIQEVLNKLKSGNIRKARYSSIDKIVEDSFNNEPPDWVGSDDIDEFAIDVENVFMLLTQRQAFICRCIYYSDWQAFEIQNYLKISKEIYESEIEEIKKVFIKII